MEEDLFRPAFNVDAAHGTKSHLFNGGPLHNKVVRMPMNIDVYAYTYMGHRHYYNVYSTGAYYDRSEELN